jgi:hypothetical protein
MTTKRLGLWLGVLAASVCTLALIMVFVGGKYALHRYACFGDASMVTEAGAPYDVEVRGESCNESGTLNFVHVSLKGAGPLGTDATIFIYEPVDDGNDDDDSNTPPQVRWVAPNHLEITVDTVAQIDRKQASAHGIEISYQVAHDRSVPDLQDLAAADAMKHRARLARL